MPYFYLDTTALVKRYSPEVGTAKVNGLLGGESNTIVIGEITAMEFYFALNKKFRLGEITRDDFYTTMYRFELDITQGLFHFLGMDHQMIKNSKLLTLKYGNLRAYHALHLALALALASVKPTVVATDGTLLAICQEEGLKVFNPEKETIS